jgi:hypothetical protein
MCDKPSDCQCWHEPISLLAAGCLPSDEQAEIRRHLAGCPACSARFRALTELCAGLRRAAPPVGAHVEAIRQRWADPAAFASPRPAAVGVSARMVWISGALAASLVAAVVWLAMRQSPVLPHARQEPGIAHSGERGKPAGRPNPERVPSPRPAAAPPTLHAYELALAQSDEAFESLLRRHSETIVFAPCKPHFLLKESYP